MDFEPYNIRARVLQLVASGWGSDNMKSNEFDSVYEIVWFDSESTALLDRNSIWLSCMIPITDDHVTCIVWDDIDYETD